VITDRSRPRVLFVDDEPAVVQALVRGVRNLADAESATSPFVAVTMLEAAAATRPFSVVVSDMRMPGMDGAALLKQARAVSPETTRVLLTGHADVDAAIAAINEGYVFRFLSKPCPPEILTAALDAAVEQYRLITGQRVLLEGTLRGAVEALVEALAMARPDAFARASRLRRLARLVATELRLPDIWQLEVAAQLGEVGVVTLPPDALRALTRGDYTDPRIAGMLQLLPAIADDVLGRIPRLEEVRQIVRAQHPVDVADQDAAGARTGSAAVLQAVREFDALTMRDYDPMETVNLLRRRPHHDDEVLDALAAAAGRRDGATVRELAVEDLREGMVMARALHDVNGDQVAYQGQAVTGPFLTLLRNHQAVPGLAELPAVAS
jgi:CheY-like chemotaxis protein